MHQTMPGNWRESHYNSREATALTSLMLELAKLGIINVTFFAEIAEKIKNTVNEVKQQPPLKRFEILLDVDHLEELGIPIEASFVSKGKIDLVVSPEQIKILIENLFKKNKNIWEVRPEEVSFFWSFSKTGVHLVFESLNHAGEKESIQIPDDVSQEDTEKITLGLFAWHFWETVESLLKVDFETITPEELYRQGYLGLKKRFDILEPPEVWFNDERYTDLDLFLNSLLAFCVRALSEPVLPNPLQQRLYSLVESTRNFLASYWQSAEPSEID